MNNEKGTVHMVQGTNTRKVYGSRYTGLSLIQCPLNLEPFSHALCLEP
jgi:hypothetical protein